MVGSGKRLDMSEISEPLQAFSNIIVQIIFVFSIVIAFISGWGISKWVARRFSTCPVADCGNRASLDYHDCPFNLEMGDDCRLCNCCDLCVRECQTLCTNLRELTDSP